MQNWEGVWKSWAWKMLWNYHQGNSENLQHREQAKSGFRCYLYTKAICCRAVREIKSFHTNLFYRMHQTHNNKAVSGTLHFCYAIRTLKSSAANLSVSSQVYPVPSFCLLHVALGNRNHNAKTAQNLSMWLKTSQRNLQKSQNSYC